MLVSRGLVVARTLNLLSKSKAQLQVIRNGHVWSYRVGAPPHSKFVKYGAEIVGGFTWWWIMWHLFHESEHLTGEFPYPDPSKWTNAELGIPPDSYEG